MERNYLQHKITSNKQEFRKPRVLFPSGLLEGGKVFSFSTLTEISPTFLLDASFLNRSFYLT